VGEAGTGEVNAVLTITNVERQRLEALEASMVMLQQTISLAVAKGMGGDRVELERRLGFLRSVLTAVGKSGDVEPTNCLAYAKLCYDAFEAKRSKT